MPEISVIIPLYNKAAFISRALNSVLSQTVQDFEIVVVDDGSTDGSLHAIEAIGDPRLRVIRQANAGPGAARNHGLRQSTAPYVVFLDADDEILPEFVERGLANLKRNPTCALSASDRLIGPNRERDTLPCTIRIPHGVWRMPANADLEVMSWASYSIGPATMCQKRPIEELGGFYENKCLFGEDVYLWIQILLHYSIFRDPTPLAWYHSEDSELNLHHTQQGKVNWHELRRKRPLLPTLTDPNPIRARCPAPYQALLERYLAYGALSEALTRASIGDNETARRLRERYPSMKMFRWGFAKLHAKLALPRISAGLTAIRRLFGPRFPLS